MNYIELINDFWLCHIERRFSTTEIALYFYLLSVSNRLGWKNPFNQSNTQIMGELGISDKTLINARKVLQEAGLIEFVSGAYRRNTTMYNIIKGRKNSALSNTGANAMQMDKEQQARNISTLNTTLMVENSPYNNKQKQNETKQDIDSNKLESCESLNNWFFDSDKIKDESIDSATNVKFKISSKHNI